MPKELPPVDLLRKLLRYEPKTGKLFWRERCEGVEPRRAIRLNFNAQFAGKEAFTAQTTGGYRVGRIFDTLYKSHRVIWAIHNGAWPEMHIDHINGNTSDNRICNLRQVSVSENAKNTKTHSHNTSGHRGVHWYKAYGKWSAHIQSNGKNTCLGYFASKDDAVSARLKAEKELGFHKNHGRLA